MVNAQEWLDGKYPQNSVCCGEFDRVNKGKKREEITKLFVSNKELEGELKLEGFTNLEELNCSGNLLTELNLTFLNSEKLTELIIVNNNLANKELSCFSQFVNLKKLFFSNSNEEKIAQGIYNH